MNANGKAARKRYGNRYEAKRHKSRGYVRTKRFGTLPYSVKAGNVRPGGGIGFTE